MREKFKKIVSVATSVLMVGSTIGFAMAAGGGFPTPFVENNEADYAIVVGAGAAASDMTGAGSINTYLNTFYSVDSGDGSTITGDFSNSEGVTEDEIELGSAVTSYINSVLTDSKIPTLLDSDFSWNDGEGSDTYDFHEVIDIQYDDSGLLIQTTLDDSELESDVVLENNKALEYRYVFDDELNISLIGTDDADTLYLTILGKEYEVLKMSDNSITVSFSDEKVVKTGDKVTSDGVTLTIGDIFSGTVEVNNVLIKEGRTRTVNGIEVYVDTIAYHSYSDLPSKAIIKIGTDISQTISEGEEYIEDDETWVWTIENPGDVGGFIGVRYDIKSVSFDEDEPEENAISVGGQYVLPENYGAVIFEGLTDVDYEDFEVSFDDKDLYGEDGIEEENVNVAILEGENDDSIILSTDIGIVETDSIYFRYVPSVDDVDADVELYFKDIDGDVDENYEGRIHFDASPDNIKLVVGDTEMIVNYNVSGITLTAEGEITTISFGNDEEDFTHLGATAETAEGNDVKVGETSIGTRDDDVFTHYGTFVRDPESNADSDRVVLSIPDEQVFAKVSIVGQGEAVDTTGDENGEVPELGGIVIKDNEVAAYADKNLIIVGGSCINAEAARLLGGHACGSDFTLKTGVTAGQYIIQSFDDGGRIAIVVAGFHAADTTRGVADFIASETDFGIVGTKVIA